MSKEKREYTPVIELEEEILRLKKQGKTRKEISEILLLPNEITVKNALFRFNKRQQEIPGEYKKRGRPRKKTLTTQRELELKVKKLEMENKVLRNFLYETGRGF
jgi:hypothetical protein